MEELSKREIRVAEYVTRGYLEKEIAEKMYISPRTVHNHTYRIRKKWGARNAVDIARIFILKLDDPKKFFTLLTFLMIQFHVVFTNPEIDLRKPGRTSTRVTRTLRKNKD